MPSRIICPYCHAPIDPSLLDVAASATVACHVCPECDRLIQLPALRKGDPSPACAEQESLQPRKPEPCTQPL